jgi:CRP-like cAMP-binding protein
MADQEDPGTRRAGDPRALAAMGRADEAIEALRARLHEQPLGLALRLRLADLLVRAGRGTEAVPLFLALAEDLAGRGRNARAIAMLKRVEALEPGREDVPRRIDELLRAELAAPAVPPLADARPTAVPAAPSAEHHAEHEEHEAILAGSESLDGAGLVGRIRGAFRRFLSTLPGPNTPELEATPELDATPVAKVAPQATAKPVAEPTPGADEEGIVAGPETPPVEAAPARPVGDEEPAAGNDEADPLDILREGQEPAPEAVQAWDAATLVDEDEAAPPPGLSSRMLELLAQVLPKTPLPEEPEPVELTTPVRTRGVAESVRRLSATPLLGGLEESELIAVVRAMRLRTFEPGAIVVTEGEPGDSLFVLTSGRVRIFVRNPSGHTFAAGQLDEGDFFGEIGSLSGRPRSATVVAAEHCELLELSKASVDRIASTHPRVREALEAAFIRRTGSPEAAAIRAVSVDPESSARAIEVLESYFGESRWDPRMRLRLADLLVRTGKDEEAIPLLVGLADELDRSGYPEKAVAILKKVEHIRRRHVEEVNLAPLRKGEPVAAPEGAPAAASAAAVPPGGAPRRFGGATSDRLESWILDVARQAAAEATEEAAPVAAPRGYAHGLRVSPLFEGLEEEAIAELIRELRLVPHDAGDVILTEGEPGQSLFIIAAGSVRVHVRNAVGHNLEVAQLGEGAFFGEMAALSGRPRTATVTAAAPSDLLEIDHPALDALSTRHPRIREVLEEHYIARAARPGAQH